MPFVLPSFKTTRNKQQQQQQQQHFVLSIETRGGVIPFFVSFFYTRLFEPVAGRGVFRFVLFPPFIPRPTTTRREMGIEMDMFRSEEMELVQLIIPAEAARDTVRALGQQDGSIAFCAIDAKSDALSQWGVSLGPFPPKH